MKGQRAAPTIATIHLKGACMSGFIRPLLLCAALTLLTASPASATPRGQFVVFEEHVVREPVSAVDLFPCLGEDGPRDDEAQITGIETRHIKVTAAGVDAAGLPIAPYRVYAAFHQHVTVDPLLAGLPSYSGTAKSVFVEQVDDNRRHTLGNAFFRATALDGSETLAFRFRQVVVVDPHGIARVDRTVAGCEVS